MNGTKKWDYIMQALVMMKLECKGALETAVYRETVKLYEERIRDIDSIYTECVREWYKCKVEEDADFKKFEVHNDD